MWERERETKRKTKIEKNGEDNKKMLWLKFKNSLNLNMLVLRPAFYSVNSKLSKVSKTSVLTYTKTVFLEEKKKNLQDH